MKRLVIIFAFVSLGAGTLNPDPATYSIGCSYPAPANNISSILPIYVTPQVYAAYYVSKAYAANYAKVFLGSSLTSWSQVEDLCYNLQFIESIAIQTGYNATKVYVDQALPDVNVTYPLGLFNYSGTIRESPGVDVTPYRENFVQSAVWTDGTKHVLTVNCVEGLWQDWSLFSANGPPDNWAMDVAFNMLKNNYGYGADPFPMNTSATCHPVPTPNAHLLKSMKTLGLVPTWFDPLIGQTGLEPLLNLLGFIYVSALRALYPILNIVFLGLPPIG